MLARPLTRGIGPWQATALNVTFIVGAGVFITIPLMLGQLPGPYALPGSTVGGDIPPDQSSGNEFNNNGTYTGVVFDPRGNLFAVDIGTAQGQIPPPDNGRLIEWFPPNYDTYCILFGPTQGGVGDHHVDGIGGLRDPGILAADKQGNIYVPEPGATDPATGQAPGFGRVLKFIASSFPTRAADCAPPTNMPTTPVRCEVFIQGDIVDVAQSGGEEALAGAVGVVAHDGGPAAVALVADIARRSALVTHFWTSL